MKLYINAKPASKFFRLEKIDKQHLTIAVKEPPAEGKANSAILQAVADYYNVPKWRVFMVAGHLSRQKVIEIIR